MTKMPRSSLQEIHETIKIMLSYALAIFQYLGIKS